MSVSVERAAYGGWENCYRLTDGRVEAVVTADVGPRVIRLGLAGGLNLMYERASDLGQTGGDEFRVYGGHRFWHAPEDPVRTYQPDNAPVAVTPVPGGLRLVAPVEAGTGMQKEVEITLEAEGRFHLTHRLHNRGPWPVWCAPWALTALAPGGEAILPLPPRGPHPEFMLPTSTLSLWPYTDLADPRWTWGRKYVRAQARADAATPQKLGALVPDGWAAYARAGLLFVKRFAHRPGAPYPDLGASVEVYTDALMLEVETLAPLGTIAPGECAAHAERWALFDGLPPLPNEAALDEHVARRAAEVATPA